MSQFRDFIPEDEDPGAYGEGGFQDFVPPASPKPQVVVEDQTPLVTEELVTEQLPVSEPTPEPVSDEPIILDQPTPEEAAAITETIEVATPEATQWDAQQQANAEVTNG